MEKTTLTNEELAKWIRETWQFDPNDGDQSKRHAMVQKLHLAAQRLEEKDK
jgi:hypothetical protein